MCFHPPWDGIVYAWWILQHTNVSGRTKPNGERIPGTPFSASTCCYRTCKQAWQQTHRHQPWQTFALWVSINLDEMEDEWCFSWRPSLMACPRFVFVFGGVFLPRFCRPGVGREGGWKFESRKREEGEKEMNLFMRPHSWALMSWVLMSCNTKPVSKLVILSHEELWSIYK